MQFGDLTELETDIALLDQGQHLLHRGRRGAEFGAAVKQRERLGDRLQVQRPVERAESPPPTMSTSRSLKCSILRTE